MLDRLDKTVGRVCCVKQENSNLSEEWAIAMIVVRGRIPQQ